MKDQKEAKNQVATETLKMSDAHSVMVENIVLKEQLLKYEKDKIATIIAKDLNIAPDKIVNMNSQNKTVLVLKALDEQE